MKILHVHNEDVTSTDTEIRGAKVYSITPGPDCDIPAIPKSGQQNRRERRKAERRRK